MNNTMQKKQWQLPQILDLDVKNTESSGAPAVSETGFFSVSYEPTAS